MIELGNTAATTGAGVKEATDATFVADVIEASKEAAIIVDFWAPWCGPCKTLGPMLESAVAATNGKARMVKVNVDENQMIAGQLRVQSIPAVFAFVDGRPVDAFMGAVPQSEIKAFIDRAVAAGGGGGGLDEALDEAEAMLEQGGAADAAQVFAAILGEDPENARAMGGMIRATLAAGDLDRAEAMLAAVPEAMTEAPEIVAARAAVELARQAEGAGEAGELRARLDANPDDHQTRFDLATALMGGGDDEGAIEELLELFRRDREWNEAAAKVQLFKLFDTLGPKDPLAQRGRRRLSSMIFA